MIRTITISLLILSSNFLVAQEVRLGITVGSSPVKRVLWDEDQYSPANTYYTYVENNTGSGLINDYKPFNAVNIGAVLNFSYRKWAFNMEPQFFYERSVYRFEEPIQLKRVVGGKGFRMPMYFTYKFFKKENSSYFLFGFNITKVNFSDILHPSEGYYFSGQEIYQGGFDLGDNHFMGVLYDNKTYSSFTWGFGKQFKKMNSSIRMQAPIGKFSERLPIETWRLEWTFSWLFLSTKDFTNKHPLYIE